MSPSPTPARTEDPARLEDPARIEEFVVAVDLGGTLTKIAYAYADGAVHGVERRATYLADGGTGLVDWLGAQIAEFAAGVGTCVGYGIVVPGIVDAGNGIVKAAPNVDWYDVPLRQRLTATTGLPGAVAHDVRSGGLAEWVLGRESKAQDLLFLPLGTGIAGAMVVDGRMLDGAGYAGEIGHICVAAAGDMVCACGQIGCLETVASAAGVARTYLREAPDAAADVTARDIADLARTGDPAAVRAFVVAVDALTEALVVYVSLLGPEVIIVGGGLSGAADLLLPPIERALDERLSFQRRPRLVTATLGPDAGLIGAGLVGWNRARAVSIPDAKSTTTPSDSGA